MTTSIQKRAKARSEVRTRRSSAGGRWTLRDAKAKLSEVIKRVHSDGPQRVSVRGEREVVIVAAEEYRGSKGMKAAKR
jgi:prevent-host-death family protein